MTLQQVALQVETLRCEATEADVLDDLLAHDGVVDADIDFANERVSVRFDTAVTSTARLREALGFFGLVVEGESASRYAA